MLGALALALGGCTGSPAPAEPSSAVPSTSPIPSPTASPTSFPSPRSPGPAADGLRVELSSGGVTLEVRVPGVAEDDPGVRVDDAGEGAATVTVDAAALDDVATRLAGAPEIALRSGGRFEVRPDGSVTVLVDEAAVGGLAASRGALVAVDDTHLALQPRPTASAEPAPLEATLGTTAVAGADWGEREGGRSLAVTPTAWARGAGRAGADVAWSELTAGDPEVDSPTMRDQLECHALGAPDKATWNLEPWRPDVGLLATLAARCNPTT